MNPGWLQLVRLRLRRRLCRRPCLCRPRLSLFEDDELPIFLVSQSWQHPVLTTRRRPLFIEPRLDNATGTGTGTGTQPRLACRSGTSCSTRPALPWLVEEEKESYQDCTVTYCTHLLWVSGWLVGAFSSSAPRKRHLHTVTVQGGTRCRPQPEAQPWNHRNSICTYGGTTDSCYVQQMHVCTSSRLTNGIVSSRYQIAYRGHSRQALVSNLLTFRPRFPRVKVSTPPAGRVICQLSVAAVGFQRPLDYPTF